MYSIFNLQRAFDPRHLSIDKEENEPIGRLKFFCAALVSGTREAGLTPVPQNILAIYGPFLNSKTFFLYFNFKPNSFSY